MPHTYLATQRITLCQITKNLLDAQTAYRTTNTRKPLTHNTLRHLTDHTKMMPTARTTPTPESPARLVGQTQGSLAPFLFYEPNRCLAHCAAVACGRRLRPCGRVVNGSVDNGFVDCCRLSLCRSASVPFCQSRHVAPMGATVSTGKMAACRWRIPQGTLCYPTGTLFSREHCTISVAQCSPGSMPPSVNGSVDNGSVDNSIVDNSIVDNGFVDNSTVDNSTVDNGFVDNRFVDNRFVDCRWHGIC